MNATQAYAKMEVHVLLILTIPTASSVNVLQVDTYESELLFNI